MDKAQIIANKGIFAASEAMERRQMIERIEAQ